jgi:hypothetical protein
MGNIYRLLSTMGLKDEFIPRFAPIMRPFKKLFFKLFNNDVLSNRDKAYIANYYSVSNFNTSHILDIDLDIYDYPTYGHKV